MGSLRKDTSSSSLHIRRDSLGNSLSSLRKESAHVQPSNTSRRNYKLVSNDSLNMRRDSWDSGRRGSSGSSSGWDDGVFEDFKVYYYC